MNVLVITEQRDAKLNPTSFEALVAGQQIAAETQGRLACVVIGKGVAGLAGELAKAKLDEVWLAEHELLEAYTPDGYTVALSQVIAQTKPDLILLPHTYQVRDFAPRLAASLGKGMIGDCVGYRQENGRLVFVRQMFQGRTAVDVSFLGDGPWFASLQAGAFRGDQVAQGAAPAPVKTAAVELKPEQIRTKPMELFREAKQAVDLTQAPVLIAVGRGIKAAENVALAEKLAKALGGELCASRPICDEGWLPMDRQIGSSGQTVAPKLYVALGISGAIQHVVGMKGSRTIVAINKDANAPIFEVADYGIVGDIFELVPALTEELSKSA
jgi:electron transfer flavoprotein alpha subunit